MSTITRTQFVHDYLRRNPGAETREIIKAWAETGRPEILSHTLVGMARKTLKPRGTEPRIIPTARPTQTIIETTPAVAVTSNGIAITQAILSETEVNRLNGDILAVGKTLIRFIDLSVDLDELIYKVRRIKEDEPRFDAERILAPLREARRQMVLVQHENGERS